MFELYFKGGFLMHPILFCSIIALTITIDRCWYFRKISVKNIGHQFEQIEEHLAKGKRVEGIQIVKSISGPIGEILRSAILDSEEGCAIIEEKIVISGEKTSREAGRGLSLLALIPSVSTMLGLLGTVIGLALAFQRVALMEGSVSPAHLASGIWLALITTVSGLLVAIPSLVSHHFLHARQVQLTFEIEHYGSRLLLLLKQYQSIQKIPSDQKNEDFSPIRIDSEKGAHPSSD